MYCPKCNTHTGADAARYCRSCGFKLDIVALLMNRNGEFESFAPTTTLPPVTKTDSPSEKGLRFGGKMLFFSLLTFPFFFLLYLYGLEKHMDTLPIVALLIPVILVFLSVLRMLYAWLFQDPIPAAPVAMAPAPITANWTAAALPGINQPPVVRTEVPNSSNVNQPSSVTEPTTNLLGRH